MNIFWPSVILQQKRKYVTNVFVKSLFLDCLTECIHDFFPRFKAIKKARCSKQQLAWIKITNAIVLLEAKCKKIMT